MGTNVVRFQQREQSKPLLSLPGPRIWTPKDLAAFLRVSVEIHAQTDGLLYRLSGLWNLPGPGLP